MSSVKTHRRVGLGVALPLLTAAATLLTAYPASAATHNIMIVGSSIPSNVRSVLVSTDVAVCVDVTRGTDKNTHLSVDDGDYFVYQTFTEKGCTGTIIKSQGVNVPQNLNTTNYWLNVS